MDVASLQTFVDVMRRGSFAAVARERIADPSSVSRQIAVLETELGFRLFDRTTRRLSPTEAGIVYHERIAPLVEELDAAREAGADMLAVPRGKLRITASVAFGERWLISRLALFRQNYPELDLDLHLSDALVDISAGGVDLGVRLGPRMSGSFVATRLMPTRYRVVSSPTYLQRSGRPERPSDLAAFECLVFPFAGYRSEWRFRSADGHIESIAVPNTMTISNALALRRAALDGLGIALLADWTISEDLAEGNLLDLFPAHEASAADFDTAAWIIYPSRSYVPAKTRLLIDHLKANV